MGVLTRFAGVIVLALGVVPGHAWADGAIAKSEQGRVGISFNYRGPRAADERAVEECGWRCRVVFRFRGQCAAAAVGRDGGGGWASRDRLGRAEDAALENCREQGNHGCRIEARGCDDR